jgi:anti-sigma regulatory factor (Ser/Thr protein kinase)
LATVESAAVLNRSTHLSRSYRPGVEGVRAARSLADELPLAADAREVVRSLIAELADNASGHAATPYTVTLSAGPDTVIVGVWDQSPRHPYLAPVDVDRESGRGLQIVAALADEWGTTANGPSAKTVWARLNLAPAAPLRVVTADQDLPSVDSALVQLPAVPLLAFTVACLIATLVIVALTVTVGSR